MSDTKILVKGIVKRDNEYLVLKKWYDDRIPYPYSWEFVDGRVNFGEDPVSAMERVIGECMGVPSKVLKPAYTWSNNLGDTHLVGIAYICSVEADDEFALSEEYGGYEWIKREEFEEYIDNVYVLQDIKDKEL